jgi:hypothetical protein
MECEEIGFVTGSGSPWGGSGGLDIALADVKKKSGRDTKC